MQIVFIKIIRVCVYTSKYEYNIKIVNVYNYYKLRGILTTKYTIRIC